MHYFDALMRVMSDSTMRLLDFQVYTFLRLLIVTLDRTSVLYNIAQKGYQTENYRSYVLNESKSVGAMDSSFE